jgi:hypothetical protein
VTSGHQALFGVIHRSAHQQLRLFSFSLFLFKWVDSDLDEQLLIHVP